MHVPLNLFFAHTATIKQDEGDKILLTQRITQLEKRQVHYAWQKLPDTGLPSCIHDNWVHIKGLANELPVDEQFELKKMFDFTGTALKDSVVLLEKSALEDITDLHDYEKLAAVLGEHKLSVYKGGRWMTDVEFGRQILNGVNPVVIERCTNLPPNFPVTTDMVKGFLNRGKTLVKEMKVKYNCIAYIIPYSGKFSWGSIFVEGQSSNFLWFNFRGCAYSCLLGTVQSCLFHG